MRRRPLVGRELWRIGDWGGASGRIGRRWELVGASMLGDLVGSEAPNQPGFVPRAYVSFVHEDTLERAVQAAGLTHSDALLLGRRDGRLAIQPVDFKWSLEVARPEQVAGETLRALLEADVPSIGQALRECLAGDEWDGEQLELHDPELLDGRFLAPDHAANRAFLDSPGNLSGERPLRREAVVLEPVDGPDFFGPLPGWQLGQALALQEGARRALDSVEGAERYYRLGAGVLGALIARKQSIFDAGPPEIDAPAELATLRRAQRLTTTEQVVDYLDRVMRARSELRKSFSQLGRQIFPFAAYRLVLKADGIALPGRDEAPAASSRWGSLYGLTQRELAARLAAEGRTLVAAGRTDAQALAELAARGPEFAREAAEIARRLAEEERQRATETAP